MTPDNSNSTGKEGDATCKRPHAQIEDREAAETVSALSTDERIASGDAGPKGSTPAARKSLNEPEAQAGAPAGSYYCDCGQQKQIGKAFCPACEAQAGNTLLVPQMELRVKVARLHGWKTHYDIKHGWCIARPDGHEWFGFSTEEIAWTCAAIPDYPNDLNACAEFEKGMTTEQFAKYDELLGGDEPFGTQRRQRRKVCASAEQRCRAFIATMEEKQ